MRNAILAAALAAGLGVMSAGSAHAMGPAAADGLAPAGLVTPAMSAAKERRLYMRNSIIAQQQRYGYRRGYGYGGGYGGGHAYGRGYGPGYGPGYGGPKPYYGGGYRQGY